MRAVVRDNEKGEEATLAIEDRVMRLRAMGGEYAAPVATFPNGEWNGIATFAALAREASRDGVVLSACGSCLHFGFSGLSFQFSGGLMGYCALGRDRGREAMIGIDFGCGEHAPAPGWPEDLQAMTRARTQAREREPRPSRLNAFEGAFLGLAAALPAPGRPGARSERERTGATPDVGAGARAADTAARPAGLPGRRDTASLGPAASLDEDSRFTMAVGKALLAAGAASEDALMEELARRLAESGCSPPPGAAADSAVAESCRRLRAGVPWREAGATQGRMGGMAIRALPIGVYHWRDPDQAAALARLSSLPTHRHPAAVESAAAAALLVALALRKRPPADMYKAVMERCAPRSPDLRACWEKLPQLLAAEPEQALSTGGLGEGRAAEEAVAAALWCFWRWPENYARAVGAAARVPDPAGRIARLAGAISGAFNGRGAIPPPGPTGADVAALLDLTRRLWEMAPQ